MLRFTKILSTFGTLEIMLMLVGLGVKIIFTDNNKRRWHWFYAFILVILISMIVYLYYNKRINGSGSFFIHLDDYKAGIKAWLTSPLFGTGFNNYEIIHRFMSQLRGNSLGTSNSLTDIIGQGGLVLITVYIAPFVMLMLSYKENREMVFRSFASLALFVVTIYHYTFLRFFILAFCHASSWWIKKFPNKMI